VGSLPETIPTAALPLYGSLRPVDDVFRSHVGGRLFGAHTSNLRPVVLHRRPKLRRRPTHPPVIPPGDGGGSNSQTSHVQRNAPPPPGPGYDRQCTSAGDASQDPQLRPPTPQLHCAGRSHGWEPASRPPPRLAVADRPLCCTASRCLAHQRPPGSPAIRTEEERERIALLCLPEREERLRG